MYVKVNKTVKSFLPLFALVFSAQSFAGRCPMPHPKYFELLSSLSQFEATIKKAPECASISQELSDLKVLYSQSDRDLVEKALNHNSAERAELSIDDIVKLSKYSQGVTSKIGGIVSALGSQSQCMDTQKPFSLLSLAQITQEVTSLGASFSGPYGVILQTGGAVVSGILRGIDAIVAARRDPYNFERSEDRIFYVTNLCTYHNIREEIDSVIYPEVQIKTYSELVNALEIKKQKLLEAHESTRLYVKLDQFRSQSTAVASNLANHMQQLVAQELSPWDRCLGIAKLYYNHGNDPVTQLVKAINDEQLKNISENLGFEINQLHALAMGENGVPNTLKCMGEKSSELIEKNNWSLSLLREMLSAFDLTLRQAESTLVQNAATDETTYGYNPIKWFQSSEEKLRWTLHQKSLLLELGGSNSLSLRREITARKSYLDSRFFDQLSPRFVEHYLADANVQRKSVKANAETLLNQKAKDLDIRHSRLRRSSWSEVLGAQKARGHASTHSNLVFELNKIVTTTSDLFLSKGVAKTYCEYFAKEATLPRNLEALCARTINQITEEDLLSHGNPFARDLDIMSEYVEWTFKNNFVDRSSQEELLQKIRNCYSMIGIPMPGGNTPR